MERQGEAYRLAAEEAWRDGRLDDAIAIFRKAVACAPGEAAIHRRLANALKAAGQLEPALDAYRLALALEPTDPDLWRQFANAARERGHVSAALTSYRHALAVRLDVVALDQLRLGFLAAADETACIGVCRTIVAVEPVRGETWRDMGESLCRAERLTEARSAYRRLACIFPEQTVAPHNIAVLDSILSLIPTEYSSPRDAPPQSIGSKFPSTHP